MLDQPVGRRPSRLAQARPSCLARHTIALALWGCLAASQALAAGLPPEDECPLLGGAPGAGPNEDAIPVRLSEGMMLAFSDVLRLRTLLPPEIWRNRDQFFHDGMRMLIGPCHRRYPIPGFFRDATEKYAGRASIDSRGNLKGYVAGLPFAPAQIDPEDPDAAVRWAWNLEHRYRGGGTVGKFRIVDLPSSIGGEQRYRGTFFFVPTRHRADLASSDYAVPEANESLWIAGGRFLEPFNARHLAWRQVRPAAVHDRFSEPDDTFVYVPSLRKVRRSATAWVDGMFTPRYRVGGGQIGSGSLGVAGGGVRPAAAEALHVTEDLGRGFVGLALRPNAYVWRIRSFREVLAPINTARSGYPSHPGRNFGPSGLSVGSDRWEVRYAVVLEGSIRERGRNFETMVVYMDYQTQQPLYVTTRRRRGLVEVGVMVHRFSGDIDTYPYLPDGGRALVFDPVLESFYSAADGGGWRRESYDLVSVPLDAPTLRRLTSSDHLARGH